MERPINQYTPRFNFNYSVSAAKKYIDMFYQLKRPNTEQRCMFAAAHYTLALQDNISNSHCKMHTNTTITLLQNVKNRTRELNSMIASAYFKRAELFEQENSFESAGQDYQKILSIFENNTDIALLSSEDKLLLAQSAISLADLILNKQIELREETSKKFQNNLEISTEICSKINSETQSETTSEDSLATNSENSSDPNSGDSLQHPLFYINKSLSYLTDLPKEKDEIWTTLAYAYQIAGLALTNIDSVDAKESFRTAISMAFKADPEIACRMLSDIYNSLGLLYEQQFDECPIQKMPGNTLDHALLYFGLALLFQQGEDVEYESNELVDTLFDCIYRVLDPYLPELSNTVIHDFIDALIFIYYCLADDLLPNQSFCQQLKEPELLNTFSHHIYWLVVELFRREYHPQLILESIQPCESDLTIDLSVCLDSLMNPVENKIVPLSPRD